MKQIDEINWPKISIIIVSKLRHDLIQQAIACILQAEYPTEKCDIVVVEETDNPQPLETPCVSYHTIPLEHRGVGFIRNEALKFATHDIVVFTDDDCIVDPTWLQELIRPFLDHPETGAVAGAVFVPDCGPVGQCENILGFPGGGVKYVHRANGQLIPLPTFSTCNCAVNRKQTGPISFEENCRKGGEDELLSRRIASNHAILYNPAAIVRHQPRDSIQRVFNWFIRRGQARIEMLPYTGNTQRAIRHMLFISPLMRFLFITLLLLLLRLPLIPFWTLCFLLYYLAILYKYRWCQTFFPSIKTRALLPIVKLTMDLALDLGSLKGRYRGKNSEFRIQ